MPAYLPMEVFEELVLWNKPPAVTLKDLAEVADWPWKEQGERVFGP